MNQQVIIQTTGDNFIEKAYGISKYFVGHNLKLQATYIDLKEEKPGDDAEDDIFIDPSSNEILIKSIRIRAQNLLCLPFNNLIYML